jgi:hypothetical protein
VLRDGVVGEVVCLSNDNVNRPTRLRARRTPISLAPPTGRCRRTRPPPVGREILEDVGNAAGVVFVVEDEVEDALGVESRVDEEELSCDQPYYGGVPGCYTTD